MIFCCQRCAFRCPTWRNHIRHTFEAHSSEPNFTFTCDINGCTKTTSKYSTLMSHLSRKHRDVDIESYSVHTRTFVPELNGEGVADQGPSNEEPLDMDMDEEVPTAPCPVERNVQRSAALFLLTLKEKYQLTQTALTFAISQVKEMMLYDNEDKRAELEAALNCQSANTSAEFDLSECFQYKNPFANLETEFLQTKYYKEYFGLVVRIYTLTFSLLLLPYIQLQMYNCLLHSNILQSQHCNSHT